MTEKTQHFEVVIIGGGPAGLAAALWCADLGLKAVLIEKESELGGQLLWTFNAIKNYLGLEAPNGRELRDRFLQHIDTIAVTRVIGVAVASTDLCAKTVVLDDGRRLLGDAMILATGVRRRTLDVPGEEEFRGRGILRSGVRDMAKVAGKKVVIVGGGDAALENALILSKAAKKVVIVHRRDEFSARTDFAARAQAASNIDFILSSQVTAITGETRVDRVNIRNLVSGTDSHIDADTVLIRIGVVPNTELFAGQIAMDERGYIVAGAGCETSLPGIFAAGDVANPTSATISGATGSAAEAARRAFESLRS